jgi:Tol biopolymer transport system component
MKTLQALILVSFVLSCAGGQSLSKKEKTLNDRIDDLQLSIRMEPANPANHVLLGNVYCELGKYDQANDEYDKALLLRPGLNDALVQKGYVHWKTGEKKKALDAFKSVLYNPSGQNYVAKIAGIIGNPYSVHQIANGPRDNAFPSCSPDGKLILFQSNRDDNWEIYVMGTDGKHAKRLTNNPARDEGPVFSPDGQTIAFTSTRDDTIHTHLEDLVREIYLNTLSGEADRRLTDNPGDDWAPVFARAGGRIMFLSDRSDLRAVPTSEKNSNVYQMMIGDNQIRQVTDSVDRKALGDYAMGAKDIYYSSNSSGNFDIYVKRLSNKPAKKLIATEGEDVGARLSHAGDKIVFFSKTANNYDIYLGRLDSLTVTRLTCDPAIDAAPVFSADDRQIIFHSNRNGSYQIYAIDLGQPISQKELLAILAELE